MGTDLTPSKKPQTNALSAGERGWQPPSWLETWVPAEPVPVSADLISREMAGAEQAVTPANLKFVAVMLDQTLELLGLPDNWETVAPFYLEAFEDVPADLVAVSLKHIRRTAKFFPKPAELRAPIVDELSRRRRMLTKLRLAKGSIKPPQEVERQPLTPEMQAKLDDIRARFGGKSA